VNGVVDHLEQYLGRILHGWSMDEDGQKLPFQVVQFERSPIQGAQVLATLGLSHVPLRVGNTQRRLRQELIMMFRESDGPRNLPGILQQIGLEALARDRAYAVGEVIGPRSELQTGSALEALYVTVPVYLPDSFQAFKPEVGDGVVFGWLVPISRSEAEFARTQGRMAFEKELERTDPDLLDFKRSAVV
jgi:hypothetical protein